VSIDVTSSHDGRVATWWLDRPEARNAVSFAMWDRLRELCAEVAANLDVRVVVLRGRGGHFSAGADIAGLGRALAADTPDLPYRSVNAAAELALATLPVPTVAAIEGNCVGGGVQIATACDIRLCHPNALFGVTPARLGIAYPARAVARLASVVGRGPATDFLLTGRLFDATVAREVGLVTQVTENLDATVEALVTELLARSSFTQEATKRVLAALDLDDRLDELGRALEQASLVHPDFAEGRDAFLAKRTAAFGPRQEFPHS